MNKALLTAVFYDLIDDAKVIARSVSPSSARVDGLDALAVAFLSPYASERMQKWLLESGCDPFVELDDGVSAATIACADSKVSEDVIDLIIASAGDDVARRMVLVNCARCHVNRHDLLAKLMNTCDADDDSTSEVVEREIADVHCGFAAPFGRWNERWLRSITISDGTRTPLHLAAFVGNAEPFQHLDGLPNSTINVLDSMGRTPLMYAIDGGQSRDFIRMLVRDFGANVNLSGVHGTALLHACRRGEATIVEEILCAPGGVDVQKAQFALHTAFGFCAEVRTIEILCDVAGLDALKFDPVHGWPPVLFLADAIARDHKRQPGRGDVLRERMIVLGYALSLHAQARDFEVRCASGQTLLMLSCAHDCAPLVRRVLELAPSPENLAALIDSKGRTAYHWACARCAKNALEVLRDFGLLHERLRSVRDFEGATAEDLLLTDGAVIPQQKHRSWPEPIDVDDAIDEDRNVNVAARLGVAHAKCSAVFDVDALPRKPRTCACCFALSRKPMRCSRYASKERLFARINAPLRAIVEFAQVQIRNLLLRAMSAPPLARALQRVRRRSRSDFTRSTRGDASGVMVHLALARSSASTRSASVAQRAASLSWLASTSLRTTKNPAAEAHAKPTAKLDARAANMSSPVRRTRRGVAPRRGRSGEKRRVGTRSTREAHVVRDCLFVAVIAMIRFHHH